MTSARCRFFARVLVTSCQDFLLAVVFFRNGGWGAIMAAAASRGDHVVCVSCGGRDIGADDPSETRTQSALRNKQEYSHNVGGRVTRFDPMRALTHSLAAAIGCLALAACANDGPPAVHADTFAMKVLPAPMIASACGYPNAAVLACTDVARRVIIMPLPQGYAGDYGALMQYEIAHLQGWLDPPDVRAKLEATR